AMIPWSEQDERVARVICDVYTPKGEPYEGDPRGVLKAVLGVASEAGLDYRVSPEVEFFLFDALEGGRALPGHRDLAGYFDRSADRDSPIRDALVNSLEAMAVEVAASHHEVGP